MPKRITRYVRDAGVICYELPVFRGLEAGETTVVQQLLTRGLHWCWESCRRAEAANVEVVGDLPEKRALTELTTETSATLLADLQEVDTEHDLRFVAVFGVDPGTLGMVMDPYQFHLRQALEHFVRFQQGPIRVVLIQIGDKNEDYVFVPHEPLEPVKKLLEAWGIVPEAAVKNRRYFSLGVASLESSYGLPNGPSYIPCITIVILGIVFLIAFFWLIVYLPRLL